MGKLQQALKSISNELSRFASGQTFWGVLADVFGVGPGQAAAHAIESQLRRGDLSQLARVEVVNAAALGPARAAYASANGTIYLSDRFVAEASQTQLQAALLEEFGHAIDARVNATDRPGDEGELFALRVRGLSPSAAEQERILTEDDRRTLTIQGTSLVVEQAAPIVYETTTVAVDASGSSSGSYSYNRYRLSGINAAWTETRGANRTLRFYDGNNTSSLSNSAYRDFGDYAISGATVVYTKSDGQDLEVYRTSAGVTTRLTTNNVYDGNLLIDGNTVVWQSADSSGTSDIYRNNGTTTTRITTNAVQEEDVQLSGSQLLWAAHDDTDYEIYLNDGTTTRALTKNGFDDYSPVLQGNRAAWLQWNNGQENLFFYNGSAARQVTTNLDVRNPQIAGNNLLYQQLESNGDISLKLYASGSRTTRTLSASIASNNVQASGNLVAWLENSGDSNLGILKLYDGTGTRTIATNVLGSGSSGSFDYANTFFLRGSKIVYLGQPSDSNDTYEGELFLYDTASSTAGSTQLTVGEEFTRFDLREVQVVEDRILVNVNDYYLKLIKPTSKPILSFSATTFSVVEGFSSPQAATLTVNLSAASSSPVTVRYRPFTNYDDENPAYAGSPSYGDYGSGEGILTFAAGTTSQTINIPIFNDNYTENDETFYVSLSAPTNAVLIPGQNVATVTISDGWSVTGANGSTFTLPAGVENLTLTGTTNINGTGNAGSNKIRGNSGNNRLAGGGFSQFSIGDELIGGLGNDTYVVSKASYSDSTPTITENTNEGTDTVEFASTATSDSYFLGDNLENLTLKGTGNHSAFGNDLNNVISGNSGSNYMDGNGGIDTVSYVGAPGPTGVTVTLSDFGGSASGWGNDSLYEFENIIGSQFNDTLTGNGANNVISGNRGKDLITGNGGSDKFDYRTLSHSLLSGFDRIADFNANAGGDSFLVATARAGFLNAGQVSTLVSDAALTSAAISSRLTSSNFLANDAAVITMGSGSSSRSFVVINNNVAGFDASADAVVEITGVTGSIDISHFVTV